MNSTNINDPVAVKAILDQLRASRLWRDTLNSSSSHISSEQHADVRESPSPSTLEDVQGESKAQSFDAAPPASVASLLSQLRSSPWTPIAVDTPPVSNAPTTHPLSQNIPRPKLQDPQPTQSEHRTPWPVAATPVQDVDIRSLSFQQALPHLTQLASDPQFLAAVSRLRQEQNELEQQLWEERQAIHKKHGEKVKVARTKATLIGAGLSKHEADMMNDAYRRDLQRFDKDRALLAWDALIQKQQATLESLGVPAMFATSSQANCQKQRRVVQVLEGL
ncbi:hypothetical protein L210DRAFT_259955 [Boletus edulis BED1]|uniref:Uncharacterized protein n=1 Tax=Boletus edulis BED1 TaxID=1328754 RepID=A0AAD4GKQ4_BOLED|nr:hypothetical protein L210DRAFT_259955 [Boletus edulis BED1]